MHMSNQPLHTMDELRGWLSDRHRDNSSSVKLISLDECRPWYYDENAGEIRNEDGTFFRIAGIRQYHEDKIIAEQPIIIQNEIGFLGILTCKINGIWHYLMQGKIEPGNVNVVQISPTLQATKSNFTQAHGGRKPEYLEYFMHMDPKDIIVDQIQSEQSSRFLGKRNRNVICKTEEILPEGDSHRWMTFDQIKLFMRMDNMVNMDTRTVLSCIPYVLLKQEVDNPFKDKHEFHKTSTNIDHATITSLYHAINDYKMLIEPKREIVKLSDLNTWHFKDNDLVCDGGAPFRVVFSDISIEGREVTRWKQPLFAANGKGLFALAYYRDEGMIRFLIKIRPEIGCFDGVEMGPTLQLEPGANPSDEVEKKILDRVKFGTGVITDCILSEEGGRFYQEQNRNVILEIGKDDVGELPPDYVWSDYGTLNILTQVNNCLNIQLRNLLALFEL